MYVLKWFAFLCMNSLALAQVPSLLFSPAVAAYEDAGFGAAYWVSGNGVDESHYAAFANWEYRAYRGAFYYSYGELDSIYRESFGTLEAGLVWKHFGVGGGYGLAMEWIPGDAFWARHRYDVGALGHFRSLTLGISLSGFSEEPPRAVAAFYWHPSPGLRFFVQGFRHEAVTGYELCFAHLCVESAFRAPGFAFALGASVVLGEWNMGGNHWFGGEDLDWNAFWVRRRLKK